MPVVRNIWRAKLVLNLGKEQIVLEPNSTTEIPQEAMSQPMIQHYLKVRRLDLVPHHVPKDVILSRS